MRIKAAPDNCHSVGKNHIKKKHSGSHEHSDGRDENTEPGGCQDPMLCSCLAMLSVFVAIVMSMEAGKRLQMPEQRHSWKISDP